MDITGVMVKGYELRERIGTGGFGAIYKAYQSTVGREVAIKMILPGLANQPDFIRRFEVEAQLVARLEHLHITPLYDYWRDAEGAYLVMRWMRGGSLQDVLDRGSYDLEATALLLDQICAGLMVAHRSGIIHRDLKPGNILLDEDHNAYLADFGIAKETAGSGDITEPGGFVGSPDYLAPEQARSEPVTPQTDIYSLGIVLYEVLTGKHPFPGTSIVERLYKHLNDPLPLIDSLDPALAPEINAVLQKATAKNPAHRYQDAASFANAFREAAHLGTARSAPTPVEILTPREQEVLVLLIQGKSNREIADRLVVELPTVKWYLYQIYKKLNVRSRVQAIVRARELNLIANSNTERLRVSTLHEPVNPYKGLHAFRTADERDFFGRDRMIQRLLASLTSDKIVSRFLAVVGPSGSGKSSLVKAGLIPALWRGDMPGSERWFIAEMLPGTHPIDELEIALSRVSTNQKVNLAEQLHRDERGLIRAAQLILPDDGSELVLVIDQFEEVFTLSDDEAQRQRFLTLLETAAQEPRSRLRVIITLRADFYDRPMNYSSFAELMRDHTELVLPLSAEELEQAITRPAEAQGMVFEDGLVAKMVAEVRYEPGALPLLQYALTELFERREGTMLTHSAYESIGGTVGALAARAEELFCEQSEQGQEAARQMFLRLVTLGEGVEDTRRRVPRTELLSIAADPDLLDELIDVFAAYRLLSLDHDAGSRIPTVELAHEALLREWDWLREWLSASRSDIRSQRQLASAAAEWRQADRDPSFLLRGARFDQVDNWAKITTLALTPDEQEYLAASAAQRATDMAVEDARNAHEAQLEKQRQGLGRGLIAALSVGLMVAIGLSVYAFGLQREAQRNFDRADTLRLAAESLNLTQSGGDPQLAALLAIRSLNQHYTFQGDGALQQASLLSFPERSFSGFSGVVRHVSFSPDGKFVLGVADFDDANVAHLWDAETGVEAKRFESPAPLVSAAFSPDGKTIATLGFDSVARLWDVATGEQIWYTMLGAYELDFSADGKVLLVGTSTGEARLIDVDTKLAIQRFRGHIGGVLDVAFSPDGQTVLTGSHDGTARLWDVHTGETLHILAGHTTTVESVAFSPDGTYAATASIDGTVQLWDVATGTGVKHFVGHSAAVYSVVFAPDGRSIFTGSDDRTARQWDLQSGLEMRRFTSNASWVSRVAISPDGNTLVTGTVDEIQVWDLQEQVDHPVLLSSGGIYAASFSPDGRSIATGNGDLTVTVWNAETGSQVYQGPTLDYVNNLVFSPDSQLLLIAGTDNEALLWDAETGEPLMRFPRTDDSRVRSSAFSPDGRYVLNGTNANTADLWDFNKNQIICSLPHPTTLDIKQNNIWSVAFSPDSRYALTGSEDMTVQLWDVKSCDLVRSFHGHQGDVKSVAFSPDGRFILTGSSDKTARLWDVNTGEVIHEMTGHADIVESVGFSPDGTSLVTGSLDYSVRLWDTETGRLLRIFSDKAAVYATAFSPDGNSILVTNNRGFGVQWDVDYQRLMTSVCARLSRDFTADERTKYEIRDSEPTCRLFLK